MVAKTLGSYCIVAEVAQGGQATLYKATHTVLGRETALKVLHPHLIADTDFVQKFEAESKILARLKHPNIVAIYDAGVDQGLYWIAMEWLDGQTVDGLIAQHGKLPVNLAVRITDQVAAALEYAHAQRLIHRDIKPGNMMLLPDGMVKVLDFGIAALVAAGQRAKTRVGTVEYMSLEQFNGQADARSDLYALGASLYHMLTGESPPSLAVYPPTPPRQLNPAVPADLEAFLYRTLARDPSGRPQTASQFQQELHATLSGSAVQPMSTVLCPYCKAENRLGARYCAKCGGILAVDGKESTLRIQSIKRVTSVMTSLHHHGQKLLWANDQSIAFWLFSRGDEDLFFIDSIFSPTVRRIAPAEFRQMMPDLQISPDGKRYAHMLGENTLQIENRKTGKCNTLKVGDNWPHGPSEFIMWLDLQRVLIGLQAWHEEKPETMVFLVHIVDRLSGLILSWPANRHLVFDSYQGPSSSGGSFLTYSYLGSVWILDAISGKETRIISGMAPRWSPDGQHIAFLRSPQQNVYELWVMRVEIGG